MKNKEILNEKKIKIIKKICIVAIIVIIIELLSMLIMKINNEKKINYFDNINKIELIDNLYYGAGSSNLKYSKFNDMKTFKFSSKEKKISETNIISEQAVFRKYDLNKKLLFEKVFDSKYNSTYYDLTKINDGFILVGSYVYKYEQLEIDTRDGLIVKYDNEGNQKWFKNYQVLGDTEFFRVIDVKDGVIAVGQSIYENMEIGNHIQGGGVIVKYDYDGNIVWKNNFGGNKSGLFNDIVEVNDGYIVCGKDGSNYGLIVKFDKKGNMKWHYNTLNNNVIDSYGFSSIKLYKNKLYISGAVNTSNLKDEQNNPIYKFDACIFVYDLNGKYLTKYITGGESDERFTDLMINDDGIIAIGYTKSKDLYKENYDNETGYIVKFDLKGKVINTEYYGGKNHDNLSNIIDNKDNYLIVGFSNSFGNKKDYNVIFKTISK